MSSADQSQAKKRQGRRKVEMVKIEKDSNLQVTFSKRRAGLFKKAGELCTLTGAEAGVVVFSPANKAHSFGHPDISTISDNFLSPNSQPFNVANELINVQGSLNPASHNNLDHVEKLLDAENSRRKTLTRTRKDSEKEQWFPNASMDNLDSQQIDHLNQAVRGFHQDLTTNINNAVNRMKMPIFPGTSSGSGGVPQFADGGYPNFGGSTVDTYDQVGSTNAVQHASSIFSTNSGHKFF